MPAKTHAMIQKLTDYRKLEVHGDPSQSKGSGGGPVAMHEATHPNTPTEMKSSTRGVKE